MAEDILDEISPAASALVFHEDGTVSIAIPKPKDDMNGKDLVSPGAQAATELLLMISDGDMSVDGLCEAFQRRIAN